MHDPIPRRSVDLRLVGGLDHLHDKEYLSIECLDWGGVILNEYPLPSSNGDMACLICSSL